MFHLGSSDAGMWVIIHSLQSHLQEGGLQAEQLGPTVILVCDADISSRALLNPLHHNSSTGRGLNTFFNYWSLQFSLDLGKNWKKFHNLFLSPQFMSVPYFKQFLLENQKLGIVLCNSEKKPPSHNCSVVRNADCDFSKEVLLHASFLCFFKTLT